MPDKQPNASTLRVRAHTSRGDIDLAAKLITAGAEAATAFTAHRQQSGAHLLLKGDRDYYVVVSKSLDAHERERGRDEDWRDRAVDGGEVGDGKALCAPVGLHDRVVREWGCRYDVQRCVGRRPNS